MDTLAHRLNSLGPAIAEICKLSGTHGVSLGILHQNEVIHIQNYGYRDVEKQIPPDQDTLYFIASLSKAFTAACVSILVDEKKLEWSTPVSRLLPDFDHPDETIKTKACLLDFLSHRTGLASKNWMWFLEYGRPSLPRSETTHFSSYLEVVHPFRQRWLYNNWGYGLAAEVVNTVTGQSLGSFLQERILDPLGMNNTTIKLNPDSDNVAQAYMALSDGTPHHLPRPEQGDGKLGEGAAGIQSSVRDLLTFYKHVMLAEQKETRGEQTTPLKDIKNLLSPHIPLEPGPQTSERSYGMGFVRTELPGSLGMIGLNPMYVEDMPIVGKGLKEPCLCIYHQGSIEGYLSSVHLLPDTNTAIVVLTNSMANNDAADWLGQLLLEAVLDNPYKNNYIAIARNSATTSVGLWPSMAKELEKHREPSTPIKPLAKYTGLYYNIIGNWCIDVFEDEGLKMCFQQNREVPYRLEHYRHDSFSWLLTRNEAVLRGRFPVVCLDFYIMIFGEADDAENIDRLTWKHDPDVPNGETFLKSFPGSAGKNL